MILKSQLIQAIFIGATTLGFSSPALTEEAPEPIIRSVIATTALLVHDLDKSIRFYSRYLGYEVTYESEIDTAEGKKALGMDEDTAGRMVFMKPANPLTYKPITGSTIGLVEVSNDDDKYQTYRRQLGPDRAILGEIMLSNRVENIDLIDKRLKEDGVNFIVPLLYGTDPDYQTGYRVLVVLDPDGNKVEMYELGRE